MDNQSIYANLPFVANEERVLFETDDSKQAEQSSVVDTVWDDVSVDVIACSTLDAFKRFANTKYEQLYEQTETSETLNDKYDRLKTEIEELSQVMTKDSNQYNKELVSKVGKLSDQLQELRFNRWESSSNSVKQVLDSLSNANNSNTTDRNDTTTSDNNVKYELYWNAEHNKLSDSSKLNTLEQRIKNIETALGGDQQKSLLKPYFKDKNITDTIEELYSKVAHFDQTHLEKIDSRLHTITAKLSEISDRKSQIEDLEKKEKINELHELVSKSETSRAVVPVLLERLETLNELQEQAMQFSSAISYLDSLQSQVSESLKNNEKQIELMRGIFDKNVNAIKGLLIDFDKRLQAIH